MKFTKMRLKTISAWMLAAALFASVLPVSTEATSYTASTAPAKQIEYQAYVQSFGWQPWGSDALPSGTTGRNKRMEAFRIQPGKADPAAVITYQAYVQDIGWQAPVQNGQIAGTMGKKKRIQAIRITTNNSRSTTITYRVYIQNRGWTDWLQTTSNTPVGKATVVGNTQAPLQIEALEIVN